MSRSIDRRGVAMLVAAGALLLALLAAAPQAEAATIYACVKKSNGTARIVTKTTKCKKGETKVSWSTVGPAGKNGANGANGATGKAGSPGAEGKEGPQGPSEVYEVELTSDSSLLAKETPATLTLSNLPPGAYAIFGKADVGPVETNGGSSYCTLKAGTDHDNSFFPTSAAENFVLGISTVLTHTFTSTGSVTMTCSVFEDEFLLYAEETRIVAIRVNSQHKTTASVST
jgi:hypothetical protein